MKRIEWTTQDASLLNYGKKVGGPGFMLNFNHLLAVEGIDPSSVRQHQALSAYRERLVIEWGPGARSWIQRAERQEKPILEIRATAQQPPFPGFSDFRWDLDELPSLPHSWQEVLKATAGV